MTSRKADAQIEPVDRHESSFGDAIRRVITGPFFPFLACVAAAFLIFFARNPDPWFNPTIYTEDGVYIATAYDRGLWNSISGGRPDYYVFGNVFLGWLSVQICRYGFDNNILLLPQIIAIVSYGFYAVTVSLPVLLMRRFLPLRFLLVLWLVTSFVPLERSDYQVLGRLSNVGFAFSYIALVLIWYRNNAARSLAAFVLTDVSLLVCAATNPQCLMMLPLTGAPYLRARLRHGEPWLAILLRKDFVLLCLLAVACLPVAHRIATGSPVYKEAPIPWGNVIEALLARNFLYPLLHPVYRHLNDQLVLVIFATATACLLFFHQRRHREFYLMAGLVLLMAAAAILTGRTWLLHQVADYRPCLAHRYFYAQCLIASLITVRLAADFMENPKLPRRLRLAPLGLLILFFYHSERQSSYANPSPQLRGLGSFETSLREAVARRQFIRPGRHFDPDGEFLLLRIYPVDEAPWFARLPRNVVERSLKSAPAQLAAGESPGRSFR